MIPVLTAGLILGLISSFHCVGMCGPLALSLPVQHLNRFHQLLAILSYHVGRIFTYASLGLFFGILGRKIYIAGFQQWLSIGLGIAILFFCFEYFVRKNSLQPAWLQQFHLKIQALMMRFFQMKNPAVFILIGLANGLLPCGMVYLAIAGALSTAHISYSILFMVFFGLGTLPAMWALSMIGLKFSLHARKQVKKIIPYTMAIMAVLLILRGMNLGIPFISPVMVNTNPASISCH